MDRLQASLPAPSLVLVAVGVGCRRQMRVEVEIHLVGAALALAVVVHDGCSPEHGEGEGLGVHPGVDETQARRPLRRPPPAVRHRRAHRRSPHASCTPQSQINQASKAREREIQVRG
jgi:hypothetical protein